MYTNLKYIPVTFNLALAVAEPSLFVAVHKYTPWSLELTDSIFNSPDSEITAVSGKVPPILDHVTVGVGIPDLLH